jgi:hypothetical protein
MKRGRPKLTFFVELETDPLEALFERPEVVPFLAAEECAVSMGLLDLSSRRAALIRRDRRHGLATPRRSRRILAQR